ncbi:MAG: ABC transporter substrate-binding protein [Chloroflexi bacterium]|nr:ABC transporter substrate-binding protein [Chloroflexota bacterium]
MVKRLFVLAMVALTALALGGCGAAATPAPAAAPTSLKLGYSVWVGYGPLFIARDKGYFKEQNLNVELTKVEDPKDRFTALNGKQLDGLVSTLDTMTLYWRAETPFVAILGLDDSSGGDGILALKNKNINSVKDLKGKSIGVNVGSVSHFFLDFLLQKEGLSDADVTLQKMKQGDVPAAMASARIDAGVTWEPHLSKAAKDPNVKILATSKDTPGLIVDVLIMRKDVLTANKDVGARLVKAWNKAIEYQKANADDAAAIMAAGLGSFYEKADDIKADLEGATLYDKARNAKFFAGSGSGTALSTAKFAIDLWTKLGQIATPIKADDMIDASYLEK